MFRELKDIQIYLDYTSMEIFINMGEEVFSLRYFEGQNKKELIIKSTEEINLNIYNLEFTK